MDDTGRPTTRSERSWCGWWMGGWVVGGWWGMKRSVGAPCVESARAVSALGLELALKCPGSIMPPCQAAARLTVLLRLLPPRSSISPSTS